MTEEVKWTDDKGRFLTSHYKDGILMALVFPPIMLACSLEATLSLLLSWGNKKWLRTSRGAALSLLLYQR